MAHEDVVGRLWAHSYPRLTQDPAAAVTCRVIRRIIEFRAESIVGDESWLEKVDQIVQVFAIPVDQWREFNSLYSQREGTDQGATERSSRCENNGAAGKTIKV